MMDMEDDFFDCDEDSEIPRNEQEKRIKYQSGHMPWQTSFKKDYLRLSKGRRKGTA